mgnify:CR=1 FL=1
MRGCGVWGVGMVLRCVYREGHGQCGGVHGSADGEHGHVVRLCV